jgi:hypothetical protein
VAAPIFQSIVEAAWSHGWNKSPLAPPSAEAAAELACNSVNPDTGERHRRGSAAECLRLNAKGRPIEARYRLVARDSAHGRRNGDDSGYRGFGPWGNGEGYSSYGSSGSGSSSRYGGWSRDDWGGWHREEQPGSQQPQRRGFWSW